MPVEKPSVGVPAPPALPRGYVLVAYEIRGAGRVQTRAGGGREHATRRLEPATAKGFARVSAEFLAKRLAGRSLAAIAWFADRPLTDCPSGRERLVAEFAPCAGIGCWSGWTPEPVGDGRAATSSPLQPTTVPLCRKKFNRKKLSK